eukprot:7018057-Pyramimonas_sp.AAC.1
MGHRLLEQLVKLRVEAVACFLHEGDPRVLVRDLPPVSFVSVAIAQTLHPASEAAAVRAPTNVRLPISTFLPQGLQGQRLRALARRAIEGALLRCWRPLDALGERQHRLHDFAIVRWLWEFL